MQSAALFLFFQPSMAFIRLIISMAPRAQS